MADPKPESSSTNAVGRALLGLVGELSPTQKHRVLEQVAQCASTALDRIRQEFAESGTPPAHGTLELLLALSAELRETSPATNGGSLTPLPLAWHFTQARVVVRKLGPARFSWVLLAHVAQFDVPIVQPSDGLEFEAADDAIADAAAHWFGLPIVRDESCDDAPEVT